MIKAIKKISDFLVTAMMIIASVLAFLLIGMKFFGFEVYTVLSGSMEPVYHTGSIIYVKDVDFADLDIGDVITFKIGANTIATHRIVEIVPDKDDSSAYSFRTKGDANEVVDGNLVSRADIIGSPVFTIPYLGFVVKAIQSPPGIYATISVTSAVLLLSIIPNLFTKEKEE